MINQRKWGKRMKTSESLDKLLPALLKVKQNLQAVTKGANNPFFKSKYADLNTHLDAVEPLLHENGLILVQPVNISESGNVVESRIYHSGSGQFISSEMSLIGENKMQDAGSAVTYARRYTLGALLSMKAEDDDGEVSMGRKSTSKSAPSKPKTTSFRNKPETKKNDNLGDI